MLTAIVAMFKPGGFRGHLRQGRPPKGMFHARSFFEAHHNMYGKIGLVALMGGQRPPKPSCAISVWKRTPSHARLPGVVDSP